MHRVLPASLTLTTADEPPLAPRRLPWFDYFKTVLLDKARQLAGGEKLAARLRAMREMRVAGPYSLAKYNYSCGQCGECGLFDVTPTKMTTSKNAIIGDIASSDPHFTHSPHKACQQKTLPPGSSKFCDRRMAL